MKDKTKEQLASELVELRRRIADLETAETERQHAEEALQHLNSMLRAIRNVNQLIVIENDRDRLLKSACDILTETRAYYNAWIALLDESGGLVTTAEAGLGKEFTPMVRYLKRGDLPDCWRKATTQSGAVVTEDPSSACTGCPLSHMYTGRAGMTVRLEHGRRNYGLINVSIPKDLSQNKEEQDLFEDVTGDIALALHDIELEEQHKRMEEELRKHRDHLEEVVDERTAELRKSNEQLLREIAERERAEEKIQQQNDFLSSVLDSLTHPFYVIDANDYTVKLANQAAKLGDLSENPTCHLLTHNSRQPCPSADHVCPLDEVKKTKKPAVVEHIHFDKDGNARNVEVHGYPILDSEGNVIQMIEYCLDITRRKQSEWELVKTNQYLDAIFSSTKEAIFTLSLKRHILTCNRAATEIFGYPEPAMIGKTTAKFYPSRKAYLDAGKRLFSALEEKGVFSEELEMRRANGEIFPADVLTSILKLGEEPLGMVAVVRDITERQRAEEALRDGEQKYINAEKVGQFGHFERSYKTDKITWSEGTYRIFGVDPDQFEPTPENFLSLVHPDDKESFIKENENVRLYGKKFDIEYRIIRHDKKERFVHAVADTFFDENGQLERLFGTVQNITERKWAERQIFEYEELNRMKSNLLSTVSHEFRTPLATIKGYSSLLLDYDRRLKRAEKLEGLTSIASTVDRLTELVEHLLDMSRLESGLLKLQKAPTSLPKLVEQTVKESQLMAPGYRIASRRDKRLPLANIDARRIRQVLDNLIDNALKYSPEGTEVTIEVRRAGPELLLKITDQGIGIPTKELPKVFDRMYRIEHRTTAQAKGIGLGLAICRGLVEAHGGRIWAESTEGKGSTFAFTLPLKR